MVRKQLRSVLLTASFMSLVACGGGSDSAVEESVTVIDTTINTTPIETAEPDAPSVPENPTIPDEALDSEEPTIPEEASNPEDIVSQINDAVPSSEEASAFLMQASFGPTESTIAQLQSMGYSAWFVDQLNQPIVNITDKTRIIGEGQEGNTTFRFHSLQVFYELAISGEDQLRQRAAFALSEIFVTSTAPALIVRKSLMQADYKDTLQRGVFGNFRDLLQDVTYHPLMGFWLTYVGNEKANLETGSAPDENYARELMQLFTIGLVELNNDGTVKLDDNGEEIEIYDNNDITELAKIFTGLYYNGKNFNARVSRQNDEPSDISPMTMHNDYHSEGIKFVLGEQVEDLADGDADISAALDIIFNQPSVAPFICTQLIQRLTYSNPHGSDYTSRCVDAFNTGRFTLPNGTIVGTGERGDLPPVWAAILLDETARDPQRFSLPTYGKAREPIIRFIHWARVSDINDFRIQEDNIVRNNLGDSNDEFGQTPYQANSVFNFFRPGFVPIGTAMGDLDLVAPEFQILTSTVLINYANTMRTFTTRAIDANGYAPQYSQEVTLASDPDALTNHMNLVMTAGRMDEDTLNGIRDSIASIELPDDSEERQQALRIRVAIAMQLAVTSSEFRTQF